MDGFRINKINLSIEKKYETSIKLLSESKNGSSNLNHYTILIGNNGTGKSRILSTIANELIERKNRYFKGELDINRRPEKIIAITNSISDKFPMDGSYRPDHRSQFEKGFNHKDAFYNYLGARNRIYGFSSRAAINRALDIIFENYSEEDTASTYRYIFDYLSYEPILKIRADLRIHQIREILSNRESSVIDKEFLRDYISGEIDRKRNSFQYDLFDSFLDEHESDLEDVAEFLNYYLFENQKEGVELILNFSEKNILRYSNDKSEYYENVKKYKVIKLLQRIMLIGTYSIRVFKKNGSNFRFDDASSGEAGILSTLLALIPLVKDNSLILIDEPEISLHPSWQYQYTDLLRKILSLVNGCHIIIATHSHFILSDIPDEDSTIVALQEGKDSKVESQIIEESAFGKSAEYILLNIFNIPSTRNWYLSRLITKGLEIIGAKEKDLIELNQIQKKVKSIYPKMNDADPLKQVASILLNFKTNE